MTLQKYHPYKGPDLVSKFCVLCLGKMTFLFEFKYATVDRHIYQTLDPTVSMSHVTRFRSQSFDTEYLVLTGCWVKTFISK